MSLRDFILESSSNLVNVYFIPFFLVFFFKQKTAYEMRISDWSSDVCSSDLYESWNHDARLRHNRAALGNAPALTIAAGSQSVPLSLPSDRLTYHWLPHRTFTQPTSHGRRRARVDSCHAIPRTILLRPCSVSRHYRLPCPSTNLPPTCRPPPI